MDTITTQSDQNNDFKTARGKAKEWMTVLIMFRPQYATLPAKGRKWSGETEGGGSCARTHIYDE